MSNDALERLKQRERPTVPVREVPLVAEDKDTSISRYLEPKRAESSAELLQTKQSTLRLEAELSDRLQAVCRENGISREVLLEGLFEYYESTPSARSEIIASAKRRGTSQLCKWTFMRQGRQGRQGREKPPHSSQVHRKSILVSCS